MIPGIVASRIRSAGGSGNDPYWQNVVLLMHFEESIVDQKGGIYAIAGTIGYGDGRFGKCLQLSTGDSGVVASAVSTNTNLPGDFTIEAWIKPTAGNGAVLNRFDVDSRGTGWQIYLDSNGKLSFYHYSGAGSYPIPSAGPDLRDGNWHHVAATRTGTTVRLFVDGVLVGTGHTGISYTSTIARLSIGYQVQGMARYPFRGGIDDVRITKGVARYTADFAIPTAPFPNS